MSQLNNFCLFTNTITGRAVVVKYNGIDYLDYDNNPNWKEHEKKASKKTIQEMADELNEMLLED